MRLFFFFISAAFVSSPEVRLHLVPAGRLSSSSSIKMALEGTEPRVESGAGGEDSPALVRAGGGEELGEMTNSPFGGDQGSRSPPDGTGLSGLGGLTLYRIQ